MGLAAVRSKVVVLLLFIHCLLLLPLFWGDLVLGLCWSLTGRGPVCGTICLHGSVCPSVLLSVCPSICLPVRPFASNAFVSGPYLLNYLR